MLTGDLFIIEIWSNHKWLRGTWHCDFFLWLSDLRDSDEKGHGLCWSFRNNTPDGKRKIKYLIKVFVQKSAALFACKVHIPWRIFVQFSHSWLHLGTIVHNSIQSCHNLYVEQSKFNTLSTDPATSCGQIVAEFLGVPSVFFGERNCAGKKQS